MFLIRKKTYRGPRNFNSKKCPIEFLKYLTRKNNDKLEIQINPLATAQVIAENECTFISINTDELSILFKRDPELKIVFMSSLTNALVAKLIAQQSQVSDLSGYSSFASMVSNYFDQGGG